MYIKTNSAPKAETSNIEAVIPASASLSNKLVPNSDIPTSLPASDVYAWAKASTKPAYTASEVEALPSTTTYAGSSSVGGAANSVGSNFTVSLNQLQKNYNGSNAVIFNALCLFATVSSSNWSSTVDSEGFYTNSVTLSTSISTYTPPFISPCGSSGAGSDATASELAALYLCNRFSFEDNTTTRTMVVKAKTKPITTFYVLVSGYKLT